MSLSLSQLFEQHKSENSPKQEESRHDDDQGDNDIGDASINRSLFDSKDNKKSSRKKKKSKERKSRKRARPSNSDSDIEASDNESLDGIKSENDTEKDTDGVEINAAEEEEEEYKEDDETVDRASNQVFYQNYSESVKVLYNNHSQKVEPQTSSETLAVVNSALHPKSIKSSGNERRIPGDYDIEGEANTFPSRSLTGRYRPRKKRIVTKLSSRKHEISYRQETEEEIRKRVQRMEKYDECAAIRARWKARTVNFQSEDDIGDAFWLRAQEAIGEKLRSDEKERLQRQRRERKNKLKQQKKEEFEKMKRLEDEDVLEEDDEVKEQSQLLAQLSQPEITPKEEDLGDPTNNSDSKESSQKLNYWELGYSVPNKSSITFDFDPSVERIVHSGCEKALETEKKRKEYKKDETKATFTALMMREDGPRNSMRCFFEPNRSLICNAKGTFRPGYRLGHFHHLLNMAARSLCGDGGSRSLEDIDLENQYIQLLCKQYEDEAKRKYNDKTMCADFRKKGFLTTLADDQGKNMLFYLQNAWDDPEEVAKQLGIMDSFQELPMGGNVLTNLKDNCKKKRLQMKKKHKLHSVNWDHENHNEDENESDHEDLEDEERSMPLDEENSPEATTNGGLVDVMTMETSTSRNDKKRYFGPSHDKRDALISPTTFYSHIVGTEPPIPEHPLDPAAWIFGPIDRFSKFYHTSVRMDTSIYKIILSTLMKRIARARLSNNLSIVCNTQDQIMYLMEEFASINENKIYLYYTSTIQDPSDSDIPLVEFYRGINEYCSYTANGTLELQQENEADGDETNNEIRNEHDESQKASGTNLIAGKIWEFCQPKIRQNALLRFPKLRITFGIALICRSINPSAAEILSSPIDDDGICTPLDLFKEALEDMESKKYIVINQNLEENSIRAVELEFLLHDAAEFFQEAVELDPTNVEYQLWHIGCLASCLLISSGNKICANTAHVHPSQMKETFLDSFKCAHEVRPCMKKYNEVRVELSSAVRALFTLVKYQGGSRAHLGLFSLLEWRQVIGLLVGSELNNFLNDIHKHHALHFGSWARLEPAAFLREYRGITTNICVPSLYAQILENDPGKITNWRNFVHSLGPVSAGAKSGDWWGKDRRWWSDSLVYTGSTNTNDFDGIDRLVGSDMLLKLKEAIAFSSSNAKTNLSTPIKTQDDEIRKENDHHDMVWLPTLEDVMVKNEERVKISEEDRIRCYANDLPGMQKNVPENNDKNDPASAFLSSISMSSGNPPLELSLMSDEVTAYKFFISCHLFGADQPSLQDYIIFSLCKKCIRNEWNSIRKELDKTCDQFRVLVWLNSMGIDVVGIIENIDGGAS